MNSINYQVLSSAQIQVRTIQESHQEDTSAPITTVDVLDDAEDTPKPPKPREICQASARVVVVKHFQCASA